MRLPNPGGTSMMAHGHHDAHVRRDLQPLRTFQSGGKLLLTLPRLSGRHCPRLLLATNSWTLGIHPPAPGAGDVPHSARHSSGRINESVPACHAGSDGLAVYLPSPGISPGQVYQGGESISLASERRDTQMSSRCVGSQNTLPRREMCRKAISLAGQRLGLAGHRRRRRQAIR